MNSIKKLCVIIAFYPVICISLILTVSAQVPPTAVPSAAQEEGAILKEKPFEEFEAKPEAEIEKEPKREIPEYEAGKKFFVEHIKVEGNTVLSQRLIDKLVAEYENRELSLADLIELADKITNLYHSKGYVTSQSYVPPQTLTDNTVIIKVLEGKYGHFKIEGAKHTNEAIIRRRLKKKKDELFNYNKLRKDLLYLNQSPDRITKAILVPGGEVGTTDTIIKVKDRPPVHIFASYDNTGNKSTGNWRLTLGLQNNSLSGWEDELNLRFYRSDTFNFYGWVGNYMIPVNEFGTKLGVTGAYFKSKIGGDFQDYGIESWSATLSPTFQHPVFDLDYTSGTLKGTFDFGMDIKEARTEILSLKSSRDRLRIWKMGLTLEESDSVGRTVVRNELGISFPNFFCGMDEDDDETSREDAGGQFIKYNYAVSRINALPMSTMLLLNLEGQATNHPLINSEQYRIGGMYTVRGYAEGDALGDYGTNASAELRYPIYLIPDDFHILGFHPRRGLQGTAFIDWGFAHFKDPTTAKRHNSNLVGIGVGGRLNFMNCISGRYDIAWPIADESNYGRSPRAHMYLSFQEPTLQQYENLLDERMLTRINDRLNKIKSEAYPEIMEAYKTARALENEGNYDRAKEMYAKVIEMRDKIAFNAEAKIKTEVELEKEIKSVFEEAQKHQEMGETKKAKEAYAKVLELSKQREEK